MYSAISIEDIPGIEHISGTFNPEDVGIWIDPIGAVVPASFVCLSI